LQKWDPPYVDIDVVSLNKCFLLYLGTVVLIFDCIALILNFLTFSSFSAVYHLVANSALKYMLHKEFIVNVSFLCVCPLIDDKLRHNIVKVAAEPLACGLWFHSKL